jgi:hypothetical protein
MNPTKPTNSSSGESPEVEWVCSCGAPLELGKVNLRYMGSTFTVDLRHCPKCGLVLIPEELAEGRMAEVERILEDK